MRLIINISGNINGGGLQVGMSFLKETIYFSENEYYVFLSKSAINELDKSLYPSNYKFYEIPLMQFFRRNRYLSNLENTINPDFVFTIFGPTYWRPRAKHLVGFAHGYYIYPESPFWKIIDKKNTIKIKFKKLIHTYFLKIESDIIVSETTDATDRVQKLVGNKKKYFTVSNTYNSNFENVLVNNKHYLFSSLEGIKGFMLLTVCNYYRHKNLEIIKDVIKILEARNLHNIKFVLTLKDSDYKEIFGDEFNSYIINIGPVSLQDCPYIYNRCNAIFLPSLVECFTANYPEAMIMKKPILTSDLPFAHSICGDAAEYFDPLDPNSIVDVIEKVLENEGLYKNLIKRGQERLKNFPSARERAKMYLEICQNNL